MPTGTWLVKSNERSEEEPLCECRITYPASPNCYPATLQSAIAIGRSTLYLKGSVWLCQCSRYVLFRGFWGMKHDENTRKPLCFSSSAPRGVSPVLTFQHGTRPGRFLVQLRSQWPTLASTAHLGMQKWSSSMISSTVVHGGPGSPNIFVDRFRVPQQNVHVEIRDEHVSIFLSPNGTSPNK